MTLISDHEREIIEYHVDTNGEVIRTLHRDGKKPYDVAIILNIPVEYMYGIYLALDIPFYDDGSDGSIVRRIRAVSDKKIPVNRALADRLRDIAQYLVEHEGWSVAKATYSNVIAYLMHNSCAHNCERRDSIDKQIAKSSDAKHNH